MVERISLTLDFSVYNNKYINIDNTIQCEVINDSNFDRVEDTFGLLLSQRFWPSKEQFLRASFGVTASQDGRYAAICYACAVAEGKAEVDIFTDPAYRMKGLGKVVLSAFIDMCINRGLNVNWDCYTNNKPSILLAQYFNFVPAMTYMHAIISK